MSAHSGSTSATENERDGSTLLGLVVAGGSSRRMGADKGLLDYHGRPQVEHCTYLLAPHCDRVFVSVRNEQRSHPVYAELDCLIDEGPAQGPAAGLMAAWEGHPESAWLVLAVDLPQVDEALLQQLLTRRDRSKAATAFRHADGTIEPLCTIWEPVARAALTARIDVARYSLRALLEQVEVALIEPANARLLESVNTPEDYAAVKEALLQRP